MEGFFDDDYKVNMGNKRTLTKEQLLAKNKEDRLTREVVRKEADSSTLIQKYLRSHVSNKKLAASIFGDTDLKMVATIKAYKAACAS